MIIQPVVGRQQIRQSMQCHEALAAARCALDDDDRLINRRDLLILLGLNRLNDFLQLS